MFQDTTISGLSARGQGRGGNRSSSNTGGENQQTPPRKRRYRGRRRRNRFLKCWTLNARSLGNKMNDLQIITNEEKPHLISITETWASAEKGAAFYHLPGYATYRKDGREGHGGTILYVSNSLEHRVCRPLNSTNFDSDVWCWIVEKGGKKVLVGSVYRSPNSNSQNNNELKESLKRAIDVAGDNRVLLMGDFNMPNIHWEGKYLRPGGKRVEREMMETLNDCFLHQHIREDTRSINDQSSLLDLIFTKEEGDIRNIEIGCPLPGSDHAIVKAEFVSEWKPKAVKIKRKAYLKGNYTKIIAELNKIAWNELFDGKTVQERWNIFKKEVALLVEKYIPTVDPKDYNAPWMNQILLRLWKKKSKAWERYSERKGHLRYSDYKKVAKKFKKKVRQSKRVYEKNLAKDVRYKKRSFFKYVNSKLTVRPEITEIQNEEGVLVDNDKGICDILGKYFSSVHLPVTDDVMPDMPASFDQEIRNIIVTEKEVEEKLEKLKPYKSCGPDNIHPCVLKKAASAICKPLTMIFNLSLTVGMVPDDWTTANVTPIHKKGDRTDPSNYRPVSLTSQTCKVLESIVREHITKHLFENRILSDRQHGFREGRSCLSNLLEIMECWTEILDEDDGIDVAYLDFRKAFDLVSHRHLLYKMSKYGITNQVLNWVSAFLSNRTQRVVIRGTASEPFEVTSGVPQGSVLGPVLFLIFINDLPLEVISPMSLFADDSKVFSRITSEKNMKSGTSTSQCEQLQKDLETIRAWATKWHMQFNVGKCKIMHLGASNQKHQYTMGGDVLATTDAERDLGVLVDDKLVFDKHIREIVNKANSMLGMIRRGFSCMDKEIFMHLYPVLVRPLLEYCVQIWSPYRQDLINLIEGVQRRATKMVPALKHMSYEDRLQGLGLTTLIERRYRGDMIQTYKILTGKEDVDCDRYFKMARERGNPDLVRGHKIYKGRCNRKQRRNTFSMRVANPWNKLPKNVVSSQKTSGFKAGLDKYEKDKRLVRNGRDGRMYNHLYHVVA